MAVFTGHTCDSGGVSGSRPLMQRRSECPVCQSMDIGRRRKAARIAGAIRKLGGGAHEARQFSDAEWIMADSLSRAKPCGRCNGAKVYFGQWCPHCKGTGEVCPTPDHVPSPETQAYVIEYLSRAEAPEFDEFPARDEDVS